MNASRLRPVFSLITTSGTFSRAVATNAAASNVEETQQLKSWTEIPGPSSLPIIGQLHHFMPGGQFYNIKTDINHELYEKYGKIVRLDATLGRSLIFLYDAESCATVLRSENWLPRRPGFESLTYYRKYHNKTKEQSEKPSGLLSDHGEQWKETRSMVNPVMLQPKTIKLYASALEEVAEDMLKRMKSNRDENNKLRGKFDFEMNLWALESIGVVALGARLNCFDPNLPKDSPARRLIQCVHDVFEIANNLDFKPNLWKYFSTPLFKKAMNLYEEQENLTRYFVRKAIEDLKTKEKTDDQKGVLEKLLEINEDIAVIMAADMLFAGVDTAANTITATLYLLAANQDKQNKLREELQSGSPETPYLKACIKESLRMMPIASGNLRETTKEYNILGYKIPKNTFMIFPHQTLSTMDSEFPRAKEYLPERWIDKDSPIHHKSAHPFAYSPFGFGVRMCIGKRIADLEMEIFVTKLIQNFKVEWFGPPPKVVPTSLNYIHGPFNFIFKDV